MVGRPRPRVAVGGRAGGGGVGGGGKGCRTARDVISFLLLLNKNVSKYTTFRQNKMKEKNERVFMIYSCMCVCLCDSLTFSCVVSLSSQCPSAPALLDGFKERTVL